MSQAEDPKRYRAQIIRSGVHGDTVITRKAVEGIVEQLAGRAVPVNIEHDPTRVPVGRMIDGCLVEVEDGEVAVEATMEIRAALPVPVAFRAASDFYRAGADLPTIEPRPGALELDIDYRSYGADDLESLRTIAAYAGDVTATAKAARFSVLPDALLTIGLGTTATATFWFSKGFFTRLGEQAAESVGPDLVAAYRGFKSKVRDVLSRRNPADSPPLTVMSVRIDRQDGGFIEVEGSSRAEGEAIDDFLDAGEELVVHARIYAQMFPEPERLTTLHFAREDGAWRLRYGLDVDAKPVLAYALSDEHFAELAAQADRESVEDSPGHAD